MATPKDEPEVYLVTPDGLRSPDQIRADAGMTTVYCCGQRLRVPPDGWYCTLHSGSPMVDADWACEFCGIGYCGDCLRAL